MSLSPRHVGKILRIFRGVVVDQGNCESVAGCVGSREELLAWLLLQRGVATALPGLGRALIAAANKHSARADTRRSEAGEPLEKRATYAALDASLRALVEAHTASDSSAHAAVRDIIGFTYFRQPGAALRHTLRLTN